MKTFLTWLLVLFKRQFKNPIMLIFLLFIPLFTLIISNIPSISSNNSYKAGIIYNENDTFSVRLVNALENSDEFVKFEVVSNYDEACRNVVNNKYICVYHLPENFTEKVNAGKYTGAISVIRSPEDSIQSSIDEIVYSEFIRLNGEKIITDYTKDIDLSDYNDELMNYYNAYADGDETFHITFERYDAEGFHEIAPNETPAFPLRGILSITTLLSAMFGSVLFLRDKDHGIFAIYNSKKEYLCSIIYPLIPAVCFSLSQLGALVASGTCMSAGKEIIAILFQIFIMTAFSFILTAVLRKSKLLTMVIPFIIMGCLVFCPVFINLSGFIPAAHIIEKFFMPYYYLYLFM